MAEYIPFGMSFEDFRANYLDGGLKEVLKYTIIETEHIKKNKSWIEGELSSRNCDWIIFGGDTGKVYFEGGMDDYPKDAEKLLEFGLKTGEVPFTYPIGNPDEDIDKNIGNIRDEMCKP